ncbi:MltR family transcriptional regulator [Vibrio sp. SS-MA-C1-2]|uniref:MltR family transcriptional regulator n=1 Tax=Vibrio sp. SS-MA-C1-2 TaxID=2908646 RepID=UPI001F24559E|nr:MltR family transcriptional regulator [Vibrio sp. SS-MA-C1-2]UJF18287.1 MltR family transcriptional regulator [Vibrio sp. SS-MA-C1-2]
MAKKKLDEARLLERLSNAESPSDCLSISYQVLNDTIELLIQSIFHKDDYAVKYVVDPLLDNQGPLGDVFVRIKLLLGLGVIGKEDYDDIEIFVTLHEWLKIQEGSISFTDRDIMFELNRINAINAIMPIELDTEFLKTLDDSSLEMFLHRHNQRVISTIVLAVTNIVTKLCEDNALI